MGVEPVFTVSDLTKTYGAVKAVDGISFSINSGACFGLLGPNGAGKTTTVEMLEGITEPTRGSILFRGKPLSADFRQEAGIMFQSTALQDFMTVREALRMFGSFYHRTVPIDTLIEQCALSEFLDRDNRKLSGGQKQRLLLAIALINDPQVLFLDEPTTGLDPQARRAMWALLESIKAQGKTIVLTTHYMEEASLLCDDLLFVDHGKIIAEGTPRQLLNRSFDDVVLELPLGDCPSPPVSNEWQTVRIDNERVEIQSTDVNASISALLESGGSLGQLQVRSRNLEDLFLDLTGQELRA
ncbi:MAG: ABC transporter ATP-binding protein [Granulosicoccus sp.]|nr:ABC transporter ATP-binding protein [Granulosicoccus sp.]